VLIQLLRVHLRPYRKTIGLVVLFQFLQTLATLYLPTLNADIIDKGVIVGDTGYIMRIGGVMLGITLLQVATQIVAVYSAPGRPWRSAGMSGARSSPGCRTSPPARSASSARRR
jgi:ABC-type multidrug transport system fused ATPase/permease subunit